MQIFHKTVESVCKHSFPEIHEVNLQTLTERHVITFRKQLLNLLYLPAWTILVKLGEINTTPLIILNKTQKFYYRVKFKLYHLQVYDKSFYWILLDIRITNQKWKLACDIYKDIEIGRFWLSCLSCLVNLLPKSFKLF